MVEKKPVGTLEFYMMTERAITDGGTWNMFVNIVEKYGIVPEYAFPETSQSSFTHSMLELLNKCISKVIPTFLEHKAGVKSQEVKETALNNCLRIINLCFGVMPEDFKYKKTDYNAQTFYKKVVKTKINVKNMVEICNYPLEKCNTKLQLEDATNIAGQETIMMNVNSKVFRDAIIKTLVSSKTYVWFSCDVVNYLVKKRTILDEDSSNIDDLLGLKDIEIPTKAGSIQAYTNVPNHAMVFKGFNKNDKKEVDRWKVQNSWGDKDFIIMSPEWFGKYVHGAIVDIEHLPASVRKIYNSKTPPKMLPYWVALSFPRYQYQSANQ